MILLIEIALTVWAWRRGWKGWALLPVGIALGMGLMIGFACGAAGSNPGDLSFLILADFAVIGVLILMVARGRTLFPEKRSSTDSLQPAPAVQHVDRVDGQKAQ